MTAIINPGSKPQQLLAASEKEQREAAMGSAISLHAAAMLYGVLSTEQESLERELARPRRNALRQFIEAAFASAAKGQNSDLYRSIEEIKETLTDLGLASDGWINDIAGVSPTEEQLNAMRRVQGRISGMIEREMRKVADRQP